MRLFTFLLLIGCLFTYQAQAGTYAQLSSGVDQSGDTITPEIVDGINGMELHPIDGLTVKTNGDYLVILAPQTSTRGGCLNAWIQVNNRNVPNSNVRICQNAGNTNVIISQGILTLKHKDVITFRMSGNVGIKATKLMTEPMIPSVIVSVLKL